MGSPRDALVEALVRWQEDDARERVARARGDADADPREVVVARHAALRGPRAREHFEEARERGLLAGDERVIAGALRDAFAAVGEARAAERVREVLARRVPHDSDHHAPRALLMRLMVEAHVGRRRAIARSLEAFAPAWLGAMRDGRADVEESLDAAAWLEAPSPPPDAARDLLSSTDDLWAELRERLQHASRAPLETWSDLLFVLRAAQLDDRLQRGRWRRLATSLAPLGIATALDKRVRVERVASSAPARADVIALRMPGDVRVLSGALELGLLSERDAMFALGRAGAMAWTHPALPPLTARATGSVGPALGALFAHLLADPRFPLADGLSPDEARSTRALALALELVELRTEAAGLLAQREPDFVDAAHALVQDAWRLEVHPNVAACIALHASPDRLRALSFAAPLFVALRERYDEDWWRNPRAGEPLRAACERGPGLSVEAWAEELGAAPDSRVARLRELSS